jgi:hypothetical protein
MKIFTLIEYKEGGDRSPCRCCTEWESGELKISNWYEKDIERVISVISGILYEQGIKKYNFDDFTLLIDGHVVTYADSSNVWERLDFPRGDGNELSKEESDHENFVDNFWYSVQKKSGEAKAAYDKAQEAIKLAEKKAHEERDRKAKEKADEDERKQYEALKQKFGN